MFGATLCISLCSPDCIISNFELESGVQSLRIPVSSEAKPQGLKPRRFAAFTARLKSCPSTSRQRFVPLNALRKFCFPLAFPADYLHLAHCHVICIT